MNMIIKLYKYLVISMPKVWMVILFGYNGQNFNGMQHQKQSNVRPIENQLIARFHQAGLLPSKDYSQLGKKYKWGRAARTDKGVHAILNAVSCLFSIPQKYYDESNQLNKAELLIAMKQIFENSEIVIHGFRKVTTRFEIRQMVQSRKYCYLCPLSYFTKYAEGVSADLREQILSKINSCCEKFIGTHNFHNYSKDLKAKDPQSKRYILEFSCSAYGQKWVKFQIRGQSFVYHQIRKIVGIIIEVFMNDYEPAFIQNTFFNNQIFIPLAPPHGLYLRKLFFDSYNRKLEVPQKLDFQPEQPQLKKLQQAISEHICRMSDELWREWYEQTRQGIVPKAEEGQREAVDDC